METEPHRITTKIYGTELKMSGKETFTYKTHGFELECNQNSSYPRFEMALRDGFQAVPWSEIFTVLIEKQIFTVEKPLSKEIWVQIYPN
jgi:hypothetical protein